MEKFIYVILDRYNVANSTVEVITSSKSTLQEVLMEKLSVVWEIDFAEVVEDFAEEIKVQDNNCGLDLEEESFLVTKLQ